MHHSANDEAINTKQLIKHHHTPITNTIKPLYPSPTTIPTFQIINNTLFIALENKTRKLYHGLLAIQSIFKLIYLFHCFLINEAFPVSNKLLKVFEYFS